MTCFDSMLNIQPTNCNSHGRVLAFFPDNGKGRGSVSFTIRSCLEKGPIRFYAETD